MAFDRIIQEVKLVGLVSLYFLVCFGLVLTLKKLRASRRRSQCIPGD